MLCSICTLLQCLCIDLLLLHLFLVGNAQPSPDFNLEIDWNADASNLSCLNNFNNIDSSVDVIWKKNDVIYSPDGSRVHYWRGSSVLHFEHTLPGDEGEWLCSVGTTESQPFTLYVEPKVTSPVHAKFELHTDFTIPCNVELGPLTMQRRHTMVSWARDLINDEESPSESNSIISSFIPDRYNNTTETISSPIRNHVLHTSNFSLSVSNFNVSSPENVSFVKYICCVHVGSTFCGETLINISFVPPSITKGLPSITVSHPGQNLSLEVQIKSFPRPNIEWYTKNTTLDEQTLGRHERFQLSVERQGNQKLSVSTLKISNLSVEDSGPISVRTSMCETSNSSESLLIVLPSVNSVTITCTPDKEKTVLMFTLPSSFPAIRTDTPGLSVQLALNFTAISLTSEQQLSDPSYEKILNLTYGNILLSYIGHDNLLLLKTKRDIPEGVLQAIEQGMRFRVQAKLIVNNMHSKEWSRPCSSAVFANHEQCKMDEIEIKLTLHSPQGTCSELQMNTLHLANEVESTFRKTLLDCKQLLILDPILNCFDNARAVFTATLRSYKPHQLQEKLAENLKVGLRVTIGEETIPVTLEMVNQPQPPESDKLGYSNWKIVAIVALLLFGIVSVVFLSIIVCVCIANKKNPPKNIKNPQKLEEGVRDNEGETERYVEIESLSRQTSTNPHPFISDDLKDDPSNRETTELKEITMPESRETSTIEEDDLSNTPGPSNSTRGSMEQHNGEAACVSHHASVQKKPSHPTGSNSHLKVKPTTIGGSLMLHVYPAHVTSRSPCVRQSHKHFNGELSRKVSNVSDQNQTVKRFSLSEYASRSHRRTFSDPSPSLEHIRQLQLEASNEKCGDQSE